MKVEKVDLKNLTTVGVGGEVSLHKVYSIEDLEKFFLRWDSFYILGGGSNLLPSEEIEVPVLKLLGRFTDLEVKRVSESKFLFKVGASVLLSRFLKEVYELGIEGLEGLWGIPGTVAGAVVGNSGAYGVEISNFINSISGYLLSNVYDPSVLPESSPEDIFKDRDLILVDEPVFVRLNKEEVRFAYRDSSLRGMLITEVDFLLEAKESPETSGGKARVKYIWEKALSYFLDRKRKQPLLEKSFGSCFKNPPGSSAGKLIDSLGLKGYSIGDAMISDIHANFLINRGNASFSDFVDLILFVRNKVKEAYGIDLQKEVRIWWGGTGK